MEYIELSDLCTPHTTNVAVKDVANQKGKYPVFGAAGLVGFMDSYQMANEYVGIIKDGAGIGRTNTYPAKSSLIGTMQCLLPKDGVNVKYLMYLVRFLKLGSSYSGATIPHIYYKNYKNTKIPKRELKQQLEIANTLNNIEQGIKVKQEQLKALDELIKSQFISTFGTYPANQKEWKTGTIRDVVSDVQYGTSRPAVKDGDYPYLRMNNITYEGELDLTDIKYINVPEKELKKCSVKNGDVLFNRTNSKELVGKSCVYDRNELMILAGFIIRVRLNQQILPGFLVAFLNTDFSKKMLFNMCKKAIGQANINAQEMQNIGIYIPPISVQKKFVSYKSKIDKLKIIVREQIKDLQELLALKMDEYFK